MENSRYESEFAFANKKRGIFELAIMTNSKVDRNELVVKLTGSFFGLAIFRQSDVDGLVAPEHIGR